MKRKFYLFLALLTGFTIFGTGNANAQTYTCLGHDIGCTYYNGTAGPYNGYSAINNVEISSGGSSIYKKTADGCNDAAVRNSGGHYNVMGASPMFTLVAGNTYELEFNITNPAGYNGYQNYFMVYLDLNGDGVYNGTGEHISSNWNTYSSVTTHTESFTIPCTGVKDGVSRLRLRTDYQYGRLQNRATDYSALGTYGETEEFVIKLSSPSSIISTFNMPDSLFVGTTDIARYTGNGGSIWWDWENNNSVDQTGGGQFTGIVSGTVGCFDLECISESHTSNPFQISQSFFTTLMTL